MIKRIKSLWAECNDPDTCVVIMLNPVEVALLVMAGVALAVTGVSLADALGIIAVVVL